MAVMGAILLSGAGYLWARRQQAAWVTYMLKPVTIALIALLLWAPLSVTPPLGYAWAILLGMLFSLVGDVFLMLPRERFVAGLAAFLVAHLWYIWAFWALRGARLIAADAGTALALLAVAVPLFRRLAAGLAASGRRALLGPVALYMTVILTMVWRALSLILQTASPGSPALWAAGGAVLFLVSDSALAWDKFVKRLPARDEVVMITYWAAQVCIGLSAVYEFSNLNL